MYLISAYCQYCEVSYEVKSGITWLGYVNRYTYHSTVYSLIYPEYNRYFTYSALNPAIYAYLNKEFKTAFRRVLCCLPRNALDGDRDAMMDEISTTSRSLQRNMDRLHVNFDLPPTPALMSRTPSQTPDTSQWPIITNNTLPISSEQSRNPSISTHCDHRIDDKK